MIARTTRVESSFLVLLPNRRFKFDKRSQLFIRMHNETLPVIAVGIGNEDCSPARIHA
jgi:hypothetical protein